jgi:hypothetical protein
VAKTLSKDLNSKNGPFGYLMRSTEIRLAGLMLIGIVRCVTISFQTTAQSATATPGQFDRFVVTLEAMFPIVML